MTKNIVFCADGTWNHPGEMEDGLPADTNVYRLYKALRQTSIQEPHYDDGVGSDGTPIDRLVGGAIGGGLFGKIKDGYTAIARSYDEGDGIFIFGFSRGAYTARSLAGMIAVSGLPGAGKFDDRATDAAFDVYRAKKQGADRDPLLAAFTARYSAINAQIAMVGVWDTVGALGVPGDLFSGLNAQFTGFLDTGLHPDVQAAYHALAIDERRAEFVPTLWTSSQSGQVVEQVWFAGVHADVGGGYGQRGLADITLGWMMQKAKARGLDFDPGVYAQFDPMLAKHALDDAHESWSPKWGFPKSRTVQAGSAISNSVAIRHDHLPTYRPTNLPGAFPDPACGLSIVPIIEDPPD